MRAPTKSNSHVLLVMALLFAFSFSTQAATDIVKTKNQTFRGLVLTDSVTEVKIKNKLGGGTITPNVGDVISIQFDIGNGEWLRGIRERNRGAFASAAESFEVLSGKDMLQSIRSVARPYAVYLWGDCLYRSGQPSKAVQAFQQFMKDYPTSRYVPLAVGSLVDSAIQTKNYKIVPPLLDKLKKLGADSRAKAFYYEGQMLLAQNKTDAANNRFNESASAAKDPETRALAKLGQARCAVLKNNLTKAKSMAEEALTSSDLPAVSGTAHMIVGKVLYAEADKLTGEPAEEKYMDALMEFMRIPVLYSGDRRTEPEALYLAAQCFARLAKFPERSKDRRRAKTMYATLLKKYNGTRWAKMAQDDLKKLR